MLQQNGKQKKFPLDARSISVRLEEAMDVLLGEYHPGDRLPSEEQLSSIMGVSRTTIREVLRVLEERGRIVRRRGVGTFVATINPVIHSGLEVLESLDAIARRMDVTCEVKDLTISEEPADSNISDKLKVAPGSIISVITRTRVMQGAVIAYMYDVIPVSIVSTEKLRSVFTGSVLEYFQVYRPIPKYAVTNLLSLQASEELALSMKVLSGTALLLLEESLFSADEQLLNYSLNYYNTNYFQYHVLRKSY